MLKPNAIQLFVHRAPERLDVEVWKLRALLNVEHQLSLHEFKTSVDAAVYRKEVKRRLLSRLWHELYGDISKELPKLRHDCLLHMDRMTYYGPEHPIQQGFGKLSSLLRFPEGWLDEIKL